MRIVIKLAGAFLFIIIGLAVLIPVQLNAQNTFPSSGNVGVGTTNPLYQFTIRENTKPILAFQRLNSSYPNGWIYFLAGWESNVRYGSAIQGYNGEIVFLNDNSPNDSVNDLSKTMTLDKSGKVGIGTSDPTELLTVNGTARAEELIVTEDIGADFVFEESYDLPSLSEVEQHIKSYKHLSGIPSAEAMKRDGVKVGELQMKLLQKIEELTLYMIELEKQDQEKEKINRELLQRIEQLEKKD